MLYIYILCRKKLPDPLSFITFFLENQHNTWSNSVITHTKHLYMDNATLGSADIGFGHILNHFGHANN